MSKSLTPSQTIMTRPGVYFNSIASHSKRTYPLNLMASRFPESQKQRHSTPERVPEFIREYIKDSTKSIMKNKYRPITNHTRSISVNSHHVPQPTNKTGKHNSPQMPCLSYGDFKSSHLRSQQEEKIYIPQIIHKSRRSKVILNSAKPISIDPKIYRSRKTSDYHKVQTIEKTSTINEESIDISSIYGPGLTYGEKIIKLKALVSSNLI